jgi:hypothetical protein
MIALLPAGPPILLLPAVCPVIAPVDTRREGSDGKRIKYVLPMDLGRTGKIDRRRAWTHTAGESDVPQQFEHLRAEYNKIPRGRHVEHEIRSAVLAWKEREAKQTS